MERLKHAKESLVCLDRIQRADCGEDRLLQDSLWPRRPPLRLVSVGVVCAHVDTWPHARRFHHRFVACQDSQRCLCRSLRGLAPATQHVDTRGVVRPRIPRLRGLFSQAPSASDVATTMFYRFCSSLPRLEGNRARRSMEPLSAPSNLDLLAPGCSQGCFFCLCLVIVSLFLFQRYSATTSSQYCHDSFRMFLLSGYQTVYFCCF